MRRGRGYGIYGAFEKGIRSGTGLGKNAEKARQMSGDTEKNRGGNVPG